jgi:hypothetical protein
LERELKGLYKPFAAVTNSKSLSYKQMPVLFVYRHLFVIASLLRRNPFIIGTAILLEQHLLALCCCG